MDARSELTSPLTIQCQRRTGAQTADTANAGWTVDLAHTLWL